MRCSIGNGCLPFLVVQVTFSGEESSATMSASMGRLAGLEVKENTSDIHAPPDLSGTDLTFHP